MTVTAIVVFKLTHAKSQMCTNITVFIFCDDILKAKQYQMTSKTKMIDILKFKKDYPFTKYYCILVCLLKK